MAEWSNASDSKSDLRAIVTGVRIPLSPPPYALRASGGRPLKSLPPKTNRARSVSRSLGVGRRNIGMWYVYFLELNNSSVYVGSTNDLKRRVHSHQNGDVTSTNLLRPI